jgi:glutaredoxin 3
MLEVIVYSTAVCPYCINAKNLLQAKNIKFTEVMVDNSQEKYVEMLDKSGRRTVPQIFIGELHIGGFDDLKALNESGELDNILMG